MLRGHSLLAVVRTTPTSCPGASCCSRVRAFWRNPLQYLWGPIAPATASLLWRGPSALQPERTAYRREQSTAHQSELSAGMHLRCFFATSSVLPSTEAKF